MDSTQDVVLGVLGTQWARLKYPGVEAYLVSLDRSGFTGRKIMIVWDIHPETRYFLIKHGFELIDVPSPAEPFFHARMRVAWEYLKDHYTEFRYIFWCDIKDFVFQSDPSKWMEDNLGTASLIGSTECVTIQQEETNQIWARAILGDVRYETLKNEEVINGGAWAGESRAMTEVFRMVHLGCKSYAGPYPPCQIWINYVLRQEPFESMLRIPRWYEGYAACLHPMWWSGARAKCRPFLRDIPPVIDLDTAVLYPGRVESGADVRLLFNDRWGKHCTLTTVPANTSTSLAGIECVKSPTYKPFALVHGYDRDWMLKSIFEFKYRFE